MEVSDYYLPETTASNFGYSLGRGARAIRTITIETINPVTASIGVGVVAGGIAGLINVKKYKRDKITKREAVIDTASESVGMGLAAGIGLLTSNFVGRSILVATTYPIIPFVLGVIATSSAKIMWDFNVKRRVLNSQTGMP